MKEILITDSLFIGPEHVEQLKEAGFQVERLDKPNATEKELIEAVKGKSGYILGGVEYVTESIIDAADKLEVIIFTGSGYQEYIPAWEYANSRGIKTFGVPGENSQAVAEFAILMALAMNRSFFGLSRGGELTFKTVSGLQDQSIGIIGLGHIGQKIVSMLGPFQTGPISYFSSNKHKDLEEKFGVSYKPMDEVIKDSDIVFLCVPKSVKTNFFGKEQISLMKDGSLLVSFVNPEIIDEAALFIELESGRIRAVSDAPLSEKFNTLPISHWSSSNMVTAFNTKSACKRTSDAVTKSMIKFLATGN